MSTEPLFTIYVQLLDEGTVVFRPVTAVQVGINQFRLCEPEDHNLADEKWEFLPHAVVEGREEILGGQFVLVARKLAQSVS